MKPATFLLPLYILMYCIPLSAQYPTSWDWDSNIHIDLPGWAYFENKYKKERKYGKEEDHLKSYSCHNYKVRQKDGSEKLSSCLEIKYTKEGDILEYYNSHRGPFSDGHLYFGYHAQGTPDRYMQYKREKKLKRSEVFEFDEQGRMVKYNYYRKDTMTARSGSAEIRYSDLPDGMTMDITFYNKGFGKMTSRWVCKYDAEGKKKEQVRYNKNGKLVHRWSYSCDDEGRLVDKDTSEVCVITEQLEDGGYIKTTRKQDKRQITKSVWRYDADSNLLDYKWYKPETRLRRHYVYTYNESGKETSYAFYRNGRMVWKRTREYNADNLMISSDYYKGRNAKFRSRSVITHDKDGNELSSEYYRGAKMKLKKKCVYENDSDGNILFAENYKGSKMKFTGKSRHQYDSHGNCTQTEEFKNGTVLKKVTRYSFKYYE
ncbi:MAG: hypothetical protein KJ607_11990 [Bacteroidetes bacterium]|nr:hypothetical protein [Bacteroidota bacterium]